MPHRNPLHRRYARGVALGMLLAGGFGPTALAHAQPVVSLSQSTEYSEEWQAVGTDYASNISSVSIWVYDLSSGTSLLESQSDVPTGLSCKPGAPKVTCTNTFVAEGALNYSSWPVVPVHPLQCGDSYYALTYDQSDGWIGSNVLTMPPC